MNDDALFLDHVIEAIGRVQLFTADGFAAFLADIRTQDAVLRNLQTLAESTQRLSPALKATEPQIEWAKIAGFRNKLAHDYFGIKLQRVWEIIVSDLPHLRAAIERMRHRVAT